MRTRILFAATAAFLLLKAPFAAANAETRIAFVNPGMSDEFFWTEVTRTMQAAADQFGFALDVIYAERDARRMIELGIDQTRRETPPDVLVLVNEFQAAPEIVQAADSRGIKVFMLLNSFVGAQLRDMGAPGEKYRNWIGSLIPSNYGAGQRLAATLISCMADLPATRPGEKHHILALAGDSRTPASLERTAGMHAIFNQSNSVVIDRHFRTDWKQADGKRQTLNYLDWADAHDVRPAGIWAANDPLALGAIDAGRERGLAAGKDFCVVGLNWSPEAVDLVHDGAMAGTDGGHFLAGAWSMVMINDYLEQGTNRQGRRKPLGNVGFDMAMIDRDNVADFVTKLGDRDWRRIPFPRFATAGGYDFSLARILAFLGE